jgi:hypothetical protein
MTELARDLNELKNLYSNPASSLNRVLDSLIRKVQDIEGGAQFGGVSQRKSIKVNDFGAKEQDDVLSHSVLSDKDKFMKKRGNSIQMGGKLQMGEK